MKEFDPGQNAASIVSVTDRVRPPAIVMPVTSVHFLGEGAAPVCAEEKVTVLRTGGGVSPAPANGGGSP